MLAALAVVVAVLAAIAQAAAEKPNFVVFLVDGPFLRLACTAIRAACAKTPPRVR